MAEEHVVVEEMLFLKGWVDEVDVRVPCKVVGIDCNLAADVLLDAGIQLPVDIFPVSGEHEPGEERVFYGEIYFIRNAVGTAACVPEHAYLAYRRWETEPEKGQVEDNHDEYKCQEPADGALDDSFFGISIRAALQYGILGLERLHFLELGFEFRRIERGGARLFELLGCVVEF